MPSHAFFSSVSFFPFSFLRISSKSVTVVSSSSLRGKCAPHTSLRSNFAYSSSPWCPYLKDFHCFCKFSNLNCRQQSQAIVTAFPVNSFLSFLNNTFLILPSTLSNPLRISFLRRSAHHKHSHKYFQQRFAGSDISRNILLSFIIWCLKLLWMKAFSEHTLRVFYLRQKSIVWQQRHIRQSRRAVFFIHTLFFRSRCSFYLLRPRCHQHPSTLGWSSLFPCPATLLQCACSHASTLSQTPPLPPCWPQPACGWPTTSCTHAPSEVCG